MSKSILVIQGDTKYLRKLRKELHDTEHPSDIRDAIWDEDRMNHWVPDVEDGYQRINSILDLAFNGPRMQQILDVLNRGKD